MPSISQLKPSIYTVFCKWHSSADACDPWEDVIITIKVRGDAQDASNEACLFLIRDHGGRAEPYLVMEGQPVIRIPNEGVFDAEEYDETITFDGEILSHQSMAELERR